MGLQVSHHEAFQRREWAAHRIGWAGIGLLIAAALLGLLGRGPMSASTARSDDGLLEIQYQRFLHLEADDMVTITLPPAAVSEGSVEVQLAQDWVRSVDISGITPEPQEQGSTPYGLRLVVSAEQGSHVRIQIAFRATRIGSVDAGIRYEDQAVQFGQFTYP